MEEIVEKVNAGLEFLDALADTACRLDKLVKTAGQLDEIATKVDEGLQLLHPLAETATKVEALVDRALESEAVIEVLDGV